MKFLSSGKLYRYCALKILKNKKSYNLKLINNIAKTITLKKLDNKKLYDHDVTLLSSEIAKNFCSQNFKQISKKVYQKILIWSLLKEEI